QNNNAEADQQAAPLRRPCGLQPPRGLGGLPELLPQGVPGTADALVGRLGARERDGACERLSGGLKDGLVAAGAGGPGRVPRRLQAADLLVGDGDARPQRRVPRPGLVGALAEGESGGPVLAAERTEPPADQTVA